MSAFVGPFLRTSLFSLALAALSGSALAYRASPPQSGDIDLNSTAPIKQGSSSKAEAYYHYSLGHMYEEMAAAYGNRTDYVNKAIDNYRLAMKDDPAASFLVEDIADLYRQSGRLREAVLEAEGALKTNPDDLNARRVLARIYTQQIGDSQSNRIDEPMLRKAVEQYQLITTKDPKDVDSLIMLGRLEKLMQNSTEAEHAFEKALAVEPDNEDAMTGLAMVYSDMGDARRASALLEKLTKNNPSPRAFAALAASYEQMHEYALAATAYKQAMELDPDRIEIQQALAQDLALSNQLDEAVKVYSAVVAANPRDSQSWLRLSQIYRQQRKFDLARESNDKAKAIDPDSLEIRYNEVSLLEAEGKVADAITTLKGILDQTAHKNYNPTEKGYRSMMLERLGLLERNVEQYDQAVDAFRQIATLDPDVAPRAEAQVIDTYRAAKDYTRALQESDAAAKQYPNDRTLREVRASVFADMGKGDEAVAELKKAFDGQKDHDRQTWLALAQTYEKMHKFDEMAKALDSAEQLSQNKDDKATVMFLRGAMYERQKKTELAEQEFRKLLDLDPENAAALNYLGFMLADQNLRLPEARQMIQKALDSEPNNGAYLDSLGWVYYRLDRLDEAERQLVRALQFMGGDPTVHDHLGDVYFKQGKIKDAITQWQLSIQEWHKSSPADMEPGEPAKVQKKLDSARVRLAREQDVRRPN